MVTFVVPCSQLRRSAVRSIACYGIHLAITTQINYRRHFEPEVDFFVRTHITNIV